MNWKKITPLTFIAILFFIFGWFMNNMSPFAQEVTEDAKGKELYTLPDTTTQEYIDELLTSNNTTNYSKKIAGRFVLKTAEYAGFNFFSPTTITWTNEMDPSHPDTLTINWLSNNIFCTRSNRRLNEECPPLVSIYKVVKLDNNQLILIDYWTGWNNYPNERAIFNRKDNADF